MKRFPAFVAAVVVAACSTTDGGKGGDGKPSAETAKESKGPSLRERVTSVFESSGDKRPVLANVAAGPYKASGLAVGQQKDLAQQRGEGLGFVRSQTLERYLQEIRDRLIAGSGVTGVPGQVIILASPSFSAHSTPDGNIYLSMGWFPYLDSEDELAAILAHESGHVLLAHHNSDILGKTEKRIQTLHELGVGTKMAVEKRAEVSKSDASMLRKVQILAAVGDQVVMPAWNRNQEREADRLAVDLLIKAGYSPAAMTSMLEKQRAWEQHNQESEEAFQKRIEELAQKNIGEAAGTVLKHVVSDVVSKVSASHPDTTKRIDDTAAYIERHYGDVLLPDPRMKQWNAIKSQPDAHEVTRSYDLAFSAKKLLDRGDIANAHAYAQASLSKRTLSDAYPNWIFAKTALAMNRPAEAVSALQRAVNSKEPVQEVYEALIDAEEARGKLESALAWTNKASEVFGEADRWRPTKVRVLRKLGRVDEATALTLKCAVESPEWKRACYDANQVPPQRPVNKLGNR